MQDIVKTSGIWLFRTSLVGMATATLIASGATTGGGTTGAKEITSLHVTGKIDNTAQEAGIVKTNLTFLKNGDDITMKRGGKTYSFKAADLKTSAGQKSYTITAGDETISLQNMSTEFLQDAKKYTTNNVDLWWANIEDKGKDITDQGYFVIGTVSNSVASTGTATYTGGATGYYIGTTDGTEAFYLGDSELIVDFAAQNISGGIRNLETAESVSFGTNVDITGGKLTSDGFTGKLKYSNGAAATNSFISGNFYGTDSAEIGGVGQIENATTALSFGFTAKK